MKIFTPAFRKFHLAVAASLVLALGCPMLAAAAAKGTLTYQGQRWNVEDALAYGDGVSVTLAFTKLSWDRAAWADDGEFNQNDVFIRASGAGELHLQLELNGNGEYSRLCMIRQRGAVEHCIWDAAKALRLQSFGQERVEGSFKFADGNLDVDVSFDLDVLKVGAVLPFPGSPLPSDGGASGKALLATLAATTAGNVDQMLALSAPDKRARLQAASEKPDFAKLMAMQKAFTPTAVKISSGSQLHDRAWLSFSGLTDGKPMRGIALMLGVNGKWYLRTLKTKQ